MGLFKKRATDPRELSQLRSEITSMAARLEAADAAKAELGDQVRGLASTVEQQQKDLVNATQRTEIAPASQADLDVVRGRLVHLANQVEQRVAAPASSVDADTLAELREQLLKLDRRIDEQVAVHEGSPGVDAAALDALRERLDVMDARIDDAAASGGVDPVALDALRHRVDDLALRFNVPISAPPTTPPPPPLTSSPDVPAPEPMLDDMTREELAALRDRMIEFGDRLDGVDSRLVSISRELALQIDELSSELDRRDDRDPDDAVDTEVVTELRDGQARLAAEQARYQIAFRADLAQLADRVGTD